MTIGDLHDALRRNGLFPGSPGARRKLEGALLAQEPPPTPSQIDALGDALRTWKLRNSGAYLARLLQTGRWQVFLADLVAAKRHAKGRDDRTPSAEECRADSARRREMKSVLDQPFRPCGCSWAVPFKHHCPNTLTSVD